MATLAVEVSEEVGAMLDLGIGRSIEADGVELRGLMAWNIQVRAEQLQEWAESAERPTERARELCEQLEALTRAFAALGAQA